MNLFSTEDIKNFTEEEKEAAVKMQKDVLHSIESELYKHYNKVISLLTENDIKNKSVSASIVQINPKGFPYFNLLFKDLKPTYLNFCKYSIFTSKIGDTMINFKYDYEEKLWYKSENGNFFPIEVGFIYPDKMVHKRTEIKKEDLRDYLST